YQIEGIYPMTDGSAWIGTAGKLVHIFARTAGKSSIHIAAPIIRRLKYQGGETSFYANYADSLKTNGLQFSPDISKLQMNFSAIPYLQPIDIQYQTRLKGVSDK